jgi:hypothetical protein
MNRYMSVAERFNAQYLPEPTSGCWLWCGAVADTGYGKMAAFGQVKASAHRVSWRLHNGDIPRGSFVCHRCDVRLCVNPAHLFLGSPADNMADMHAKGRHRTAPNRGAANHNAKLTEEQVREIRANGRDALEVARELGVSRALVYHIRNGRAWRHAQ